MHFLGAGPVQEIHRLPQLSAPDDGVVHQQQLLALDELRHGNLLHFRHQIAHLLIGGHEGAGPGGGVLDEGPGEGLVGVVGIADAVGQAGIRHARYIIHIRHGAVLFLVPGHDLAVAVAHDLHVDPLVVGVGVAVVAPQEGADLHFLAGSGQLGIAIRGHLHDFTGAEVIAGLIAQLLAGKGFHGGAEAVLALTDNDGKPAHLVPRGNQTVGLQNQDGAGAFDGGLGVADAIHQIVAAVNEGCGQLRGVDRAGGHGHELVARAGEGLFHQLLGVGNDAHGGDGKEP